MEGHWRREVKKGGRGVVERKSENGEWQEGVLRKEGGGQEEGGHKELIRREARGGGVDTSLITMSRRIHES